MSDEKKPNNSDQKEAEKDVTAPVEASASSDIVDAEVVEEAPVDPSENEAEDAADSPENGIDETPGGSAETEDASLEQPEDDPEIEEPEIEDAETGDDDAPERVTAEENQKPEFQPAPVVERRGGFWPMVFGGAVAAAGGFGLASFVFPDVWATDRDNMFQTETAAAIDAHGKTISNLGARIEEFQAVVEENGQIKTDLSALGQKISAFSENLLALEARLSDVEKRPITEGASPAAVAAYERELKALQDAMANQRAEIEAIAQQAAEKEASAELTAQEAMKRAALSRILTALDSGTGFGSAVADLKSVGVDVPAVLAEVSANGTPTNIDLAQAFPEAARAALSASRTASQQPGGFGAFLKNQLGARSLEPKEGDDADAVLSRSEAALREGRLGDALAELDALPEEGRAEMEGWVGLAETRQSVLGAAEELGATLNSN